MKEEIPHVVCDGEDGVVRCNRCGEQVPMPLGAISDWVLPVLDAFGRAHKHCEERSEPRDVPVTGMDRRPTWYTTARVDERER